MGAFLNDKPICVSPKPDVRSSVIAYGLSAHEEYFPLALERTHELTAQSYKVRATGSAVLHLVYVACGRFDGFVEIGLHHWDIAAGVVIVREAGGRVSVRKLPSGDYDFVCSNGRIHEELKGLVRW
jgi:myo-inositol-1(or 4)-monophosphatase